VCLSGRNEDEKEDPCSHDWIVDKTKTTGVTIWDEIINEEITSIKVPVICNKCGNTGVEVWRYIQTEED